MPVALKTFLKSPFSTLGSLVFNAITDLPIFHLWTMFLWICSF